MRAVVLSLHPLASAHRERLESRLGGEAEYVALAELRRRPLREVVRTARTLRGRRCIVAAGGAGDAPGLPVAEALAAVGGAASLEALDADFGLRPLSRARAAGALAGLARASADGALAVRRARRKLRDLLGADRQPAQFGSSRRLLYLNANLWFGLEAGGSVAHVAGVANALARAGYDVEVAAATPPGGSGSGVGFRRLPAPEALGFPVDVNYVRFSHAVERQLLRELRRDDFAFLYQRLSVGNYAGVPLSRALGIPLVVEYNGDEVWVARNWSKRLAHEDVAHAAQAVCLRHAHLVVTVSGALRDELLARGVEAQRIVCHPNGADPDLFDPTRFGPRERAEVLARYGIDADALVVAFSGSFGHWHGVDVLAEAIARLVDGDAAWLRDRAVRFLLVGDGVRMPEVRRTLEPALAERVAVLAGLVPLRDAPAHLAAADVLVSPHVPNRDGTPFFGSPTKLFEYMLMERAIVASELGQLGEVLAGGLRAAALPNADPPPTAAAPAILCEPGSVDDLVHALRFVVDRPAWRPTLARNARARALGRYTWEHHVRAILAAVERERL